MVTSSSANALVRTHAVRRANGSLDVLIDNEDPSTTYSVGLNYSNFTPSGSPTVFTLANNGTSITSTTQSSATSVTVAPYTLTVVQVPGSGGTGTTAPGAPGQPTVSNLTSTGAVLSWPAATAGSYPIARYDVYSGTTLATTTTGTSVTLTGLTIGTTYTYNVVAVDNHGNASLPSAPVTFTVPPPANSSCAVHYEVTSSWNGGFGASITITNRATTAVTGWKLTFAWPDAGEAVQSGWNGTWSQTGQQVTVANADWNRTIAAGGSVQLGFNGTDTGAAPAPTVFSLNGTVCSSV
jgi:cellulase/cellobiase CelA1